MKKLSKSKNPLLIGASVILVLIAGFILIRHRSQNNKSENLGTKQVAMVNTPSPTVNYEPATDAEKQQAEDHKSELASSTPTPTPSSIIPVKPIIINAYYSTENSQLVISGIVPGVLESGGTCTAILTSGPSRVERNVKAVADANTTNCPPVTVLKNELVPSGVWDIQLAYKSNKAVGNSDSRKVAVP